MQHHILILGDGCGCVYAALQLNKTLARDPDVTVTLVNRDNFFLFTPMLHEVAVSDLDMTHIVNPVHTLLRRVQFFAGEVEAIDLPGRRVTVAHGFDRHTHDIEYDQLTIELGAITNFFNLPGLETRALTMKSLGDAIQVRNRLIALLEEANSECCAAMREALLTYLLTYMVAGGGFAGVKTLAEINDFAREALRFYPNLREDMLRMVQADPGEVILPELNPKLGRCAQQKLAERGVDIRVNTRVPGMSEQGVELSEGTGRPRAVVAHDPLLYVRVDAAVFHQRLERLSPDAGRPVVLRRQFDRRRLAPLPAMGLCGQPARYAGDLCDARRSPYREHAIHPHSGDRHHGHVGLCGAAYFMFRGGLGAR